MPLNAIGWTTEEDQKLAELVEPNSHIYNVEDPSRKNILARESTWQDIAQAINKPVEECKKRWRGLRDGYMRVMRNGSMHKSKSSIIEKLQFLVSPVHSVDVKSESMDQIDDVQEGEQVITDGQEYYEITVVDSPQQEESKPNTIKMVPYEPKKLIIQPPPGKVVKRNGGRKRNLPILRNSEPIKILPKPVMAKPSIVRYVEDTKTPEPRSQVLDNLIERVLRENTNEIDVFFRSMAASVKKLPPSLIPKVKMEVCNVIAKYEMQSFDKK